MTLKSLAHYFDHTALKPAVLPTEIEQLCAEAIEHGFRTVCIHPIYISIAKRLLANSPVEVCTVVGFPLGSMTTESKVSETVQAIELGAREIDMVIWIGGLKARIHGAVRDDIQRVAEACHEREATLKVIIECALLTDDEKRRACEFCIAAKADMVKTSTGFASGGATVADVQLLSECVRAAGLGVKAAGGIKTFDDAQAMIAAGATRIGASSSVDIMKEAMQHGIR